MNSTQGAYKAKLREGFSKIENRRRSRGVERKKNRNEEINKRRNLSDDMSPVKENTEPLTLQTTQRPKKRDTRKADNVLERLKQWREDKKRRIDEEKKSTKSKPSFKVGALARDVESELYKRKEGVVAAPVPDPVVKKGSKGIQPGTAAKSKTANKPAPASNDTKKIKPVQNVREKEKKKTAPVSQSKTKESTRQLKEAPNPPANGPKVLRATKSTANLANKLTAAAAAKRNNPASPKKFLRATRASTLQKKEAVDSKKGSKGMKMASKSTGNLLNVKQTDPEVLETVNGDKKNTAAVDDVMIFQPPPEVPKILLDFNFSAMTSENSSSDDKATSSDNPEFTFAGLPLKQKRKSCRKSLRLATLENNGNQLEAFNLPVVHTFEDMDDDTFAGLPLKSKRKSVRKSVRLANIDNGFGELENLLITFSPDMSKRKSVRKSMTKISEDLPVSTPKSAKRKSMKKIPDLDFSVTKSPIHSLVPVLLGDNMAITTTPKSAGRKSKRKSLRLDLSLAETESVSSVNSPAAQMSVTPKSTRRKSTRNSKVLGSTAKKQFRNLHISEQDEAVAATSPSYLNGSLHTSVLKELSTEKLAASPMVTNANDHLNSSLSHAKNKRKSIRKSLAKVSVGSKLNTGEEMETQPTLLDEDTQAPLVEITSTPKDASRSAKLKRKGLLQTSATISSIEDVSSSSEMLTGNTPKSILRRSHGSRRSSLTRRSGRRSVKTPARMRRSGSIGCEGLNASNSTTPNSVRNSENIPRSASSRRSFRKSTVISVSDEGTAIGRDLEPATAYTVEKAPLSAKASRILKELIIEKVDGEKSFFEVSFDESVKGSPCKSMNRSTVKFDESEPTSTLPFTPRQSNEITGSTGDSDSMSTPKSALRSRHSTAVSSGFKEPGLPLSALRKAGGSQRRKTEHSTPSKTPEQMIKLLKKSPMIEMERRKSRHLGTPSPSKGRHFRDLIQTETDRMTELCNKWNAVATAEEGLTEDILGQIRSTVGKALLLMEQRFKQFSGLVDNYVYDLGEKKTTPTDLQGFWEMIYFQVEDVDAMFKDLDELQQANWQVKKATPKLTGLKKKLVKPKPKPKAVKSNFAAFKAQLQKKKAAQASSSADSTEQMDAEMLVV